MKLQHKLRLPDVHFGTVKEAAPPAADDLDPDDEELSETPADVIAMLGFDPKEVR